MADERVFSEQEVGQIIRRAVELSEEGVAIDYTPGVTREELARIASEIGVSAEALNRAISEQGATIARPRRFRLAQTIERVVEGEIDPSQFDIITEGVRPFSRHGEPSMSQVGRKLTMSAWTGCSQARVEVVSRNGRTRIKVQNNALFPGLMTLHPALMATLVSAGSLSERGMGALGAIVGLIVMTVGAILFAVLTRLSNLRAEKLANDVRDRVADAIAADASTQTPTQMQVADMEAQQRLSQS